MFDRVGREALMVASQAVGKFEEHIKDCGRRWDVLRSDNNDRDRELRIAIEKATNTVSAALSDRLATQDAQLSWVIRLIITVGGTLVVGMCSLIIMLIHGGGKL